MNALVFYKLLAIFIAVAIGWFVGRMRWLGEADAGGSGGDPARVLSNAAFFIFVPALLFRTTARLDFNSLPWLTLSGFFGPVLLLLFIVYIVQRRRGAG
ncbi:AEC family transporter, partial [Roseateles sp. GG27B]